MLLSPSAVPFVIFALPRSRTAWLAHWLHAPEHPVGHDIVIECDRMSDFARSFACGMRGTVETGAIEGWRQIVKALPNGRFLTVRRPLNEVKQSLAKFGLVADAELEERETMLDAIEAEGFAERVNYTDLLQRGCRKWIWEYFLPEVPFDVERDATFAQTNIQVDMQVRVAQLVRRSVAIASLKEELRYASN